MREINLAVSLPIGFAHDHLLTWLARCRAAEDGAEDSANELAAQTAATAI